MNASATKGNRPESWQKLLDELDEKLQLGLLDRLRRVSSYHFEEKLLLIEPGNKEDEKYLSKDAVLQQLQVFASGTLNVEKVQIRPIES